MYLISGCLLGYNCKYNGGNNMCQRVVDFANEHSSFAVCPETAGDLPVPRDPSEIISVEGEKRIISKAGIDVTSEFVHGAEVSLKNAIAEAEKRGEIIEGAILKANSPSCGSGKIYDGSFSGKLVDGNGIFTELLNQQGIKVVSELDNFNL